MELSTVSTVSRCLSDGGRDGRRVGFAFFVFTRPVCRPGRVLRPPGAQHAFRSLAFCFPPPLRDACWLAPPTTRRPHGSFGAHLATYHTLLNLHSFSNKNRRSLPSLRHLLIVCPTTGTHGYFLNAGYIEEQLTAQSDKRWA